MIWNETKAAALETLRAAYLAEVERLAEELRPKLETGEMAEWGDEPTSDGTPRHALESACGDRFGCRAYEKGDGYWTGSAEGALAVLAVSPSAAEEVRAGFFHIAQAAQSAVAVDVLAIANGRGWIRRAA